MTAVLTRLHLPDGCCAHLSQACPPPRTGAAGILLKTKEHLANFRAFDTIFGTRSKGFPAYAPPTLLSSAARHALPTLLPLVTRVSPPDPLSSVARGRYTFDHPKKVCTARWPQGCVGCGRMSSSPDTPWCHVAVPHHLTSLGATWQVRLPLGQGCVSCCFEIGDAMFCDVCGEYPAQRPAVDLN